MGDELVKDGLKVDDNNRDFIFGLIHHAIRGVTGVAHHAIHAVRGLGHAILGDEEQKDSYGLGQPSYLHSIYGDNNDDYYYGYGYHPYYHHHYYHHVYYGDVSNDQD